MRTKVDPTEKNKLTLIISLYTPHYVIQVSDRRLTYVDSKGKVNIHEENSNKLTVLGNRFVFGYTGLAYIHGKATDVWLTEVLSEIPDDKNFGKVLEHLQERSTKAFRSIWYKPSVKRLAFVGVGWTSRGPDEPILPIMCRVSNFHDEAGKTLALANNRFRIAYNLLEPPLNWAWVNTGAYMSALEVSRLTRLIGRCGQHGTGPGSVTRLCAQAIRNIAAREKTVGENLLAVFMPKSVALQEQASIISPHGFAVFANSKSAGPGSTTNFLASPSSEFIYMPKGDSAVWHGPNLAVYGFAIIGARMTDMDANPDDTTHEGLKSYVLKIELPKDA